MTDGSLHGDCKVFNKVGLLTRVERIQDRLAEVDLRIRYSKIIKVEKCLSCGDEFDKLHGNSKRCEDCAIERNIQIQKEWKERRRETSRKRDNQDPVKRVKRRPRLQGNKNS